MIQILPKEEGYGEAAEKFGSGLVKGYTERSDEMAIQKAIEGLGPNPKAHDVIKAVTGVRTYGKEGKKTALQNWAAAGEFEETQRKNVEAERLKQAEIDEKAAERKAKLDKEIADKEIERRDAEATLALSGKYSPEEVKAFGAGGGSATSARTLARPKEEAFEKESDKFSAKRQHDYIEETQNNAKHAQTDLVALDIASDLADDEATGFKLQNAAADFLERQGLKVEALRDPKSKAFNSTIKTLMTNFGDIVRGKVSNLEFDTLRGMLAQAEDSPQAAKAMLTTLKLNKRLAIEENHMMQAIRKEYSERGLKIPSDTDLGYLVEQRFRPIADQMTRETVSKLRQILKPGGPIPGREASEESFEDVYGGGK